MSSFRVGMHFSTSFLQLRSWNTQGPSGPYPGNTWRQGIWNTVPVRKAGGVGRDIHKYLIALKQGTLRWCPGAHCTKLDSHQRIPLPLSMDCQEHETCSFQKANNAPSQRTIYQKKKKKNPRDNIQLQFKRINTSGTSIYTNTLALTNWRQGKHQTTQASHWETQLKYFQESN